MEYTWIVETNSTTDWDFGLGGHRMTGNTRTAQPCTMHGIIFACVMLLLLFAPARAQTRLSTQSPDGQWLTDGYGELIEIQGDDLRSYEITTLSCISAGKATRKTGVGTSNEIVFAGEDDTLRISAGPSLDTRWLHADGSVSNVLLRRMRSLPEPCRQPPADAPL